MTWIKTHVITPTGAARFWVSLGLFGLAVGIAVGLSIAYTQHVQRQICGLIILQDDAYRDTPPTTDTGRRVAAEIHRYRNKIGC